MSTFASDQNEVISGRVDLPDQAGCQGFLHSPAARRAPLSDHSHAEDIVS
jgi:hypothetical protein